MTSNTWDNAQPMKPCLPGPKYVSFYASGVLSGDRTFPELGLLLEQARGSSEASLPEDACPCLGLSSLLWVPRSNHKPRHHVGSGPTATLAVEKPCPTQAILFRHGLQPVSIRSPGAASLRQEAGGQLVEAGAHTRSVEVLSLL